MSALSKMISSRDNWKKKATVRAERNRYLERELKRVKDERDKAQKEARESNEQLKQRSAQASMALCQSKEDVVFIAIQLFVIARISFRAISRVLEVLSGVLGIKKAPAPQTVINWVTRFSMVRIQSAEMLRGRPLSKVPSCNGLIWMIDTSIGLGSGKILTVLAMDASHYQFAKAAPGFDNVRCVGVAVAGSWTGETIAEFLKRLIAVTGRPAAYLKDGGSDLKKAVRLLDEQGLGSSAIDDISHTVANLLKKRYEENPMLSEFIAACGRVSGKVKQTILACLAPPKIQTKARFMNLHRLVIWADRLLKLSPVGGAKKDSVLAKLRTSFDQLPAYKTFIKNFRDDAEPLLACQKILKVQCVNHESLAKCQPLIERIPSNSVRVGFAAYLQRQLETAGSLGLDKVGLPICSDQIESFFGLAKQHGVSQIKDADRIAIRIPALCGAPTREEVRQVLKISVAEQQKITENVSSLIKQRRNVLKNPDRLEDLNVNRSSRTVELIPMSKNRSNTQEIIYLSDSYKKERVHENGKSEDAVCNEVLVLSV